MNHTCAYKGNVCEEYACVRGVCMNHTCAYKGNVYEEYA